MIYSRRHGFIFLANRKTASTSIAIALSAACGPNDVITPLGRDERLRTEARHRGPQNFIPWNQKLRYCGLRISRKLTGRSIDHELRKIGFHTHMSAAHASELIGIDAWNKAYKFCFIRNPWDRAISQYFWEIRGKTNPITLDAFIDGHSLATAAQRSRDIYTINSTIALDSICRFESLSQELGSIYSLLAIPGPPLLPKAKSQFREDKRHYRDILSKSQADRIAAIFAKEIEIGRYDF